MKLHIVMTTVCICGILAGCARGAADPADASASADRAAANARLAANGVTPYSTNPADKQKVAAQQKADLAEYKAVVKDNLTSIKEMFKRAEAAWAAKNYKEAGLWYQSVASATVPGAEDMVDTANTRINSDMENMAKDHVRGSVDAGLRKDYQTQIDELNIVVKDLGITKTAVDVRKQLTALKSKPEIAGMIEYAQAEQMLADNRLTEALTILNGIVANQRYEHSISALKAQRKLDELSRNEDTRSRVKTEFSAKAEKEAPQMLAAAKNYAMNNMKKAAIEKLELVCDKFPGTQYEDEAKKRLAELK
jgi:outer membrane protein assembly factor BamD (BamD/ComL family)